MRRWRNCVSGTLALACAAMMIAMWRVDIVSLASLSVIGLALAATLFFCERR